MTSSEKYWFDEIVSNSNLHIDSSHSWVKVKEYTGKPMRGLLVPEIKTSCSVKIKTLTGKGEFGITKDRLGKSNKEKMLGTLATDWSLWIGTGAKCSNSKFEKFVSALQPGDIFECKIDWEDGTLTFIIDEISLIAFKNDEIKSGILYFAFSLFNAGDGFEILN